MLVTFSAFVMTSISGERFDQYGLICEICVCIWAGGDLIEEIISAFVISFHISLE